MKDLVKVDEGKQAGGKRRFRELQNFTSCQLAEGVSKADGLAVELIGVENGSFIFGAQ